MFLPFSICLSVKFDANSFIDDRYRATLRLRGFGWEMLIRGNFGGVFGDFNPLKLWNYCFDPKRYALPAETRVLRYCTLNSVKPCSNRPISITLKKLLAEVRKVILYILSLSPKQFFGEGGPPKMADPIDLKGYLCCDRQYRIKVLNWC